MQKPTGIIAYYSAAIATRMAEIKILYVCALGIDPI
jgi:hypothetical protein